MRYERKYRAEGYTLEEICQLIHFHRASFRKAFPDRCINSLYLDTTELDFMHDNIMGLSGRTKQRIRWYGHDLNHISKPVLEIKIKNNELGKKQYVTLPDFKIDQSFDYEKYMQNHLWLASNNVVPTVMVQYLRSYYESFDKQVRLTIDRDQKYYPVDKRLNFNVNPFKDDAIIIEVKYPKFDTRNLDYITQDFPFRLTRNSKYVQAMISCY